MNPSLDILVNELLDAWNARDLDRLVGMMSPDVEWYDLGNFYPPARGREGVREFANAILVAFPDFRYEIIPPLCFSPDGTRCAMLWSITATQTGVYSPPGFAPTNRRAKVTGVDVVDVQGGKITRVLSLFDLIDAAEQLLGVRLRPAPRSLRERIIVLIQRVAAFFARKKASIVA